MAKTAIAHYFHIISHKRLGCLQLKKPTKRESGADMFLNYFALGVLIFVFLVLFYGIIMIHDIPYTIAKKRHHPHADAIHTAGWVSLFTLHVIWPFLWIWATLYQPERGWGMQSHIKSSEPAPAADDTLVQLSRRVAELEQKLAEISPSTDATTPEQ